ncbi:hypothetical protein [Neptunomonas japonica]|uniref:hypothetical protein n=1 Tax=Neptunomonas japonica TaxID=417574 RepID=UPI0003FEB1DD|nr:hypothetical protein [Neptunomonas japonica]
MSKVEKILLLVCMLVSFPEVSFAKETLLERSEVAAFIGSRDVLHDLSEEMKVAGVRTFYTFDRTLMANKSMPVFFENVRIMQENSPAFYDRFTGIVTNYSHDSGENSDPVYRFKSANDWAQIGDRIMLAYFTENSTASRTAYDDFMAQMPPGMLEMLKPEDRAKVDEQLGLLQSAQNVPEGDKKLVESFKDKLKMVLIEIEYEF